MDGRTAAAVSAGASHGSDGRMAAAVSAGASHGSDGRTATGVSAGASHRTVGRMDGGGGLGWRLARIGRTGGRGGLGWRLARIGRTDGRTDGNGGLGRRLAPDGETDGWAAAVSAGASHGQPQEDLSAATERTTPQDAVLARFWSSIPMRLPYLRFFSRTVRSDPPARNPHKQNPSLSLSGI